MAIVTLLAAPQTFVKAVSAVDALDLLLQPTDVVRDAAPLTATAASNGAIEA